MKERPILFGGPMVRAILEGRKSQTRRVLRPQPHDGVDAVEWQDRIVVGMNVPDQRGFAMMRGGVIESEAIVCPYGRPGDRLWVRETHKGWYTYEGEQHICYKADNQTVVVERPSGTASHGMLLGRCHADKWRPSIHMPRWASRITLEVTGVRVERLQDITEEDAVAEGCSAWKQRMARVLIGVEPSDDGPVADTPEDVFAMLWDSINAKRGHGWETNPWVWVVEFKRAGLR